MSRRQRRWFRVPRTTRRPARSPILRTEILEPRLALTWGGVPPATIAVPTALTAVTLDAQSDATGAASIAGNEVDYYSFTAPTSGTYTISATTPTSSLDSVVGIFSAAGQRLAYNDDISFSNTDSRVSLTLTAGTRVYLGVTNYSSSSRGTYSWSIDGPAPAVADDAYENNDSFATAYDLGSLTTARTLSQLVMADSQDWFKFTASATGTAANSTSISFLNAQGDLDLALYNAAGTLIGTSQGTGNSESISLNGLAAGTYWLRVYGYNGVLNPNYSLTVNPPAVATGTSPVSAFPDVPYYGGTNDWNLNAINAPEAWARGYTGQGIVVAVVDTGVDLNHPDLDSRIWVNADEIGGNGIDDDHNGFVDDTSGWDFASGDNNPDDQNGHGTHVAGTIAAEKNGTGATGVAPDATIMPVRVLGSDGSGTSDGVAAGIRYAAQNGANIINLSLGGSFSSVIQAAIQYAQQLNVLVVVAAGNESAASPSYPARVSATLNNVISVGAHSSSGAIASFSNHVGSSGAVQVDGPGAGVYSTYIDGRYATLSGTSMATPHVAGLAALALSANRTLTASQLRSLVVDGTTRTISGSDSHGGVNAAVTVALAASGRLSSAAATQSATTSPFGNIGGFSVFSARGVDQPSLSPAGANQVARSLPATDSADQGAVSALQAAQAAHAVRDQALLSLADADELDSRACRHDAESVARTLAAPDRALDASVFGIGDELLCESLALSVV